MIKTIWKVYSLLLFLTTWSNKKKTIVAKVYISFSLFFTNIPFQNILEYIRDLIFSIWVELMASESKSTNLLLIFCTSSNYYLVIGGRIFSGHHSLLLPIHATTCNRNYITKGESTRSGFSVIFFI